MIDTLLECEQLLRPECLVVDLRGGLDEVLQVRPGQEVAQMYKLAVVGIFDIHNTPAVLASANRLAVNDHIALGADHSEGDNML